MKTMNKWLLAGLIGISSVAGSSQGALMLDDFNTAGSVYATRGTTDSDTVGNADLYVSATGANNPRYPEAGITISGGQALIHYERIAAANGTARGVATLTYLPADFGDLTGYTGITLNFGAAMPDFLGGNWMGYDISGGGYDQPYGFYIVIEALWGVDQNTVAFRGDAAYGPGYAPSGTSGGNPSWTVGQDYTWNFADQVWWDQYGSQEDWSYNADGAPYYIDPSTISKITIRFDTGSKFSMLATSANDSNGILLNYIQLEGGDEPVPEPETVWMIVAVLASLAVTFRRQLTSLFVKA